MKAATYLITSASGLVAMSDADSPDKAVKNVGDALRLPNAAGLRIQPLQPIPSL